MQLHLLVEVNMSKVNMSKTASIAKKSDTVISGIHSFTKNSPETPRWGVKCCGKPTAGFRL